MAWLGTLQKKPPIATTASGRAHNVLANSRRKHCCKVTKQVDESGTLGILKNKWDMTQLHVYVALIDRDQQPNQKQP
jgi:hypothetical protein